MKKIILMISLLFIATSLHAGVVMTQQQYENQDILVKEIKKDQSDFLGFAGPKDNMRAYGISDEQAQIEINKLDLDAIIAADAITKQEAEDTKEEQKLLKMLDRQNIKAKIKAIKNQP